MPEKKTIERARQAKREGKAPTTQAGEFVKEEIEHIREGKHGARSTKQAIAIGLSKARRAGVKLPPPKKGKDLGANPPQRGSRLSFRARAATIQRPIRRIHRGFGAAKHRGHLVRSPQLGDGEEGHEFDVRQLRPD